MPETTALPSMRQLALGDLQHEFALTRRVLERVPEDRFTWKPHDKSMSLGRLATHLTELAHLGIMILQHDAFDVTKGGPPGGVAPSREDLLRRFDEGVAALSTTLEAAGDAVLAGTWTMKAGDHVVMSQPRLAALRTLLVSHMVHHRAQLGVYLRLNDVPLPGIYGPTADERGG